MFFFFIKTTTAFIAYLAYKMFLVHPNKLMIF